MSENASKPEEKKPEEKVFQMKACPSCGAAVSVDETKCWMCGWRLADEIYYAQAAPLPAPAPAGTAFNADVIAAIGSVVVLGGATLATFFFAPGIAVLLAIVFIIVLFALAKSLRSPPARAVAYGHSDNLQQAYAAPLADTRKHYPSTAASVVAQLFTVLGIVMLVAIAAVIAFCTFCVICFVVLTSA